jgi:tetratricopeptide (TPR) repeat protein
VNLALRLLIVATACLAFLTCDCKSQSSSVSDSDREKAIVAEQGGDNVSAEKWWRTYLRIHDTSAEANAHLGLIEARQGQYKDAVPYYRKALALDPTMPGLRLNFGLSLFKIGELKSAIETFTPLLREKPPSPSEIVRLNTLIGMSHYGLGEYAAAVPFLKAAAAADQQSLWLRLALAQSCLGSKQYQCVLNVYHEILNLNAESAEADMLAGEALDEMKDHQGAIQQFRAAAKADSKLPDVHFGLGYVLWTQNQFDEAAPEFQAELANVPGHPQALTYLADVDIKLGNETAARPLLEKAIAIDPRIALAHLDLGIILADAGTTSAAFHEMKTAEQLNPGDQNVHWRLARFLKSIGRSQEAKVEFDKTRRVQKAADESLFNQLHPPQSHDKTTGTPSQVTQLP